MINNIYLKNLTQLKYPENSTHVNFLYKLVSGVHVNINMHISRYYLENIENEYDPDKIDTNKFYQNYDIYYQRIGKHPERIKNLFYTYVFLIDCLTEIKDYLPKYTYDVESNHRNNIIKERMRWLGRYVSELVNPHLIESDLPLPKNLSNVSIFIYFCSATKLIFEYREKMKKCISTIEKL